MKKLLLILLSLTLVLSFAACGDDTPEVTCEHVDIDGDFKCEFCGEQLPCGEDHTDVNSDGVCDRCDAAYTCTDHIDENKDNVCDECDAEMPSLTIAQVRAAATGTQVRVDGTVAAITYAFGKVPAGVILVDETSSIYVYGGDLAASVQVGNNITITASKTYWILEYDQTNADKFGYK